MLSADTIVDILRRTLRLETDYTESLGTPYSTITHDSLKKAADMIGDAVDKAAPPTYILLTGSRAYGTPRPDSDIDIVICIDTDNSYHVALLQALADKQDPDKPGLHVDDVNFIIAMTDEIMKQWVDGTDALLSEAPVSRDRACKVFNERGVTGGSGR